MVTNICILNFSGRSNGNCAEICRYIECFHSNSNICVYKVNEHFLPRSSCDYECLKCGQECPNCNEQQRKVLDSIIESDMAYYVLPNFCGFPCANYFTFNERTVGYFHLDRDQLARYMSVKKKFIVVSNTESHFFAEAMQQQAEAPDILYLKTSKYGKQSICGDLMESDEAKRDLRDFLMCI